MIFSGFQKHSLIEWPGKIVSIVWVAGCNFRCPFCYNQDLVLKNKNLPVISSDEVLAYLKNNRQFIEGIMITGGEPLVSLPPTPKLRRAGKIKNDTQRHPRESGDPVVYPKGYLIKFIEKVKESNFLVGVETNGTNPEAVEYLIKNNLVDYWAMDIKAPLVQSKYDRATGVKVNLDKIKQSIQLIMNSGVEYEFRTTVVPGLLNIEDIVEIARAIKGAPKYVLQQFVPQEIVMDEKYRKIKPYSKEELEQMRDKIKDCFEKCELRG